MAPQHLGLLILSMVGSVVPAAAPPSGAPSPIAERIEHANFSPLPVSADRRVLPEVVKAEVWLARAGFSPGMIDGVGGDNFRKALSAYQGQSGLPATGTLDQASWDRLSKDTAPILDRYAITRGDAKGPFTRRIPSKFADQSRLKRLGYHDIREELAERFHMGVSLLLELNRSRRLAGSQSIAVLAVSRPSPPEKAARVVVDKTGRDVEAFGADGKLVGFYPASIGSEEKPAPSGQFEIRRIVHNPNYTYEPKYHFKGVKATQPFTIAPGPNNPVGAVWMDLSYEGYGIHGTPEPSLIGKTQSHGCIRLTNWDAESLAGLVDKGTPVTFQDGPAGPSQPPAAATPSAEASPTSAGPAPKP